MIFSFFFIAISITNVTNSPSILPTMKNILFALSLSLVVLPMQAKKDIVDTAVGAGSFKTLVAAVKAAGLVDTLKGEGPFTVFAPTDEAFAKLPKGTVESLLKPENKKKLTAILTYHVVAGKVKAKKAAKLDSAKTVQGDKLTIKPSGETLRINSAKVVKADVKASNGIIHVIDSVLIPDSGKKGSGKKVSMESIIVSAINKGVPLFNSGHHAETATIYVKAGKEIVEMRKGASSDDKKVISAALRDASKEESSFQRAWIMRRAFDKVLR